MVIVGSYSILARGEGGGADSAAWAHVGGIGYGPDQKYKRQIFETSYFIFHPSER